MTFLITEEDHKAVREALDTARLNDEAFRDGYYDAPIAILDKLQRVEVVGWQWKDSQTDWEVWNTFGLDEPLPNLKSDGEVTRDLYAVKD